MGIRQAWASVRRAIGDRRRLRDPRAGQVAAVIGAAVIGAAVIWGVAIARVDGGDGTVEGAAVPFGERSPSALSLVVGPEAVWTIGVIDRRLRGFSIETLEPVGPPRRVGGEAFAAAHIAAGQGAVWVGLEDGGRGALVRIDPATGRRRIVATDGVLPERILVLPGRVVVLGDGRVAAVPRGGGRSWSHALPDGIDVAAGYGSIWTLSALPGARSLVTRREPGTGRVVGRRTTTAGATAIAVGLGAVWIANGCHNGVLRAPVGPGAGTCVHVGKGPVDIAVGGGAAWAADAPGRRIAELDGATGAVARSWAVPGRPSAVAASGQVVVAATRRGDAFRLQRGEPAAAPSRQEIDR